MSQFALHPGAFADIDEIRSYIANDHPDAADRIVEELFEEFAKLAQFPHSGHVRPDLASCPLRFHILRVYLIAYAPEQTPLWIVAVLHGRRNPRVLAALLRDRI
jgi:plasmid stabilization system protein ParE